MAAVQPLAKITTNLTNTDSEKYNEVIGYTRANVMNDTTAANAILSFGQAIAGLTSSRYNTTIVTYDVDLAFIDE